jgi:serine protease Do
MTKTVRTLSTLLVGVLLGAAVFAGVYAVEDGSKAKTVPVADVGQPAPAEVASGRQLARDLSLAFQHAAELVKPAVVPIYSERPAPQMSRSFGVPLDEEMLRRFFGDRAPRGPENELDFGQPTVRGLGSGVVVSPEGYVLTNNHVVAESSELYVVIDEERYPAELIGADPGTDLAVIKIDPARVKGELPVADLGTSEDVQVGQWVIAVGNPFELLHSVTAGIVSAKGRVAGLAQYEDFIQTDASINRGNSGGALADLEGRVIGINTAIAAGMTGGNVGIGFAIPIDMAKRIMADLIEDGQVARGYLGVLPQDIDDALVKALGLESRRGALVAEVSPDTPAERAGMQRGDVVVELDGKAVANANELRNLVATVDPGREVAMKVLREGKPRTLRVELAERPRTEGEGPPPAAPAEPESYEKLGLRLSELSPQLRQRLRLDDQVTGVVVLGVSPGTPAARGGLQGGDLILEVAGRPIGSIAALREAVAGKASGESVAVLVRRGALTTFVGLELP